MPRDTLTLSLDLAPRAPLLPARIPYAVFKVARGRVNKRGIRPDGPGCWQVEPRHMTAIRSLFLVERLRGADCGRGTNIASVFVVVGLA